MLTNPHHCPDWDFLFIEPADPETECCTCPQPMSDAALLEMLAIWLDAKYPHDDREVQIDLRRIAKRLRQLDGAVDGDEEVCRTT